jgi:hypothetical protein
MTGMNDLYAFFVQGRNERPIHKWHHYFEAYDRHLGRFRDASPTVLELGVQLGGSLEMWRRYFGSSCRLYGVDIDPATRRHEDIATKIFIGDQADRSFLREVLREVGQPDIVLDDGGHTANQQITSFEELYPAVAGNGLYMVEDTHTSLWGGSYMDRADGQSFLDFAAARCAQLMEWTSRRENFGLLGSPGANEALAGSVSSFCRTTKSISFYDSIVVFERSPRRVPLHERRSAAATAGQVPRSVPVV